MCPVTPPTIHPHLRRLRMLLHVARPNSGPRWGTIFITRRCNLRCSYCVVPRLPRSELSTAEWCEVLDKLVGFGVRHLTIVGGEPTIRGDLEEIVRHATGRGLYVFLHSNFLRLDDKRIDRLAEAGLSAITTSADRLEGPRSLHASLVDRLNRCKTKGILPIVSAVITADNVDDIPQFAAAVVGQGFLINLGLYQSVGGQFSFRDPRLIPPRQALWMTFAQLRLLKAQSGLVRVTDNFMDERHLRHYYEGWKCNPFEDHWLVVNSDGTLMRCQEYASDLRLLELKSLNDPAWQDYKTTTVRQCPGCYHHCYFDAETLSGNKILQEWRGALRVTSI